jgi:uncharacterized repeat protein (TIGR03803 family)
MRMSNLLVSLRLLLVLGLALKLHSGIAVAQVVEKVADLNLAGGGPGSPLDRFTQVGSSLWFTTEKGGVFDPAGTISRFDLETREVVVMASLQNSTGTSPESSLLIIGDEGYFTTKSGGTGNAGTIAKINLTSGTITTLFNFPQNIAATRADGSQIGATPRAGLTRIGDELWTIASSGGISNRGAIVKYNLTNETVALVANLDGPLLGGQAFDGFTAVGTNEWYFTTFSGGSTFATPGLTLGAGTLGRLMLDESGAPVLERLIDLPGGATQFPALAPTLVGTNSLYFSTTGPNIDPGAIIRYDFDTDTWTNLFSFPTVTATNIGSRPGYSGLLEFRGDLFFINRLGGTNNAGAVMKFNIASNSVTKLADLGGPLAQSLGSASGFFGSGTLVTENGRNYVYFPLTSGGVNNNGTIIRIDLAAFRINVAPAPNNQVRLWWEGGYPPFTLQQRTNLLEGEWSDLITDLTNRAVSIPATNPPTYFRVIGQP